MITTQIPIHTQRRYNDHSRLAYTQGYKDNWKAIYITKSGNIKNLYDETLLSGLKYFASQTSSKYTYQQFVKVYNLVTSNAKHHHLSPQPDIYDFAKIRHISHHFQNLNPTIVNKTFDSLYLEMIAECHYAGTKLYHRLKRLGVYQTLFLNYTPHQAAKFSYHKNYQDLNQLMIKYGF